MRKRIKEEQRNTKKGSLPLNRKEQFFLLLKNNYMKMVIFSMITFVFFIPAIVVFLVMNYQTSLLLREENAKAGDIIFSSSIFFSLYSSPTVAIVAFGLSGLFSVMKGFVYDEPVSYSSYFQGIKQNIKAVLFITYFVYLFFVLFLLSFARFFYLTSFPSFFRYGIIALSGIVFLIAFSMSLYMCTSAVRYKANLKQLISNAFKLTFHKLYLNIFISLSILALVLIAVIFNVIVQMIIFLLMFVYLLSFFALLVTSYHASIYDEFVNKRSFPSIYRAGLKKDLD